MIQTRRWKNVVIFLQTILSFLLSRKYINIYNDIAQKYGNVTVKDFRKYKKLEYKKEKLKLHIDFANNCKQLLCIRNSLSLNCQMFLIKAFYQFVKNSFVAPSTSVIKNIFPKNSVYQKIFYLRSFLLLTSTSLKILYHRITRYRSRNSYTLKKKSYLH